MDDGRPLSRVLIEEMSRAHHYKDEGHGGDPRVLGGSAPGPEPRQVRLVNRIEGGHGQQQLVQEPVGAGLEILPEDAGAPAQDAQGEVDDQGEHYVAGYKEIFKHFIWFSIIFVEIFYHYKETQTTGIFV